MYFNSTLLTIFLTLIGEYRRRPEHYKTSYSTLRNLASLPLPLDKEVFHEEACLRGVSLSPYWAMPQ